ncbi:hypothetical protein NE235_18485 [Actinoallomurus spadix]|uniref:Trypsin-co-occurring domain-containing protein n=1 Tax=Actinoallomurus spadix TaxID=79912 RepID=A0ABN0VZL9_9ACTN|nr:CU044_2847 family protein [Actinoallomurus spadix]MCO5988092.1 hypothetical protein [Actinoallomurus spadix]
MLVEITKQEDTLAPVGRTRDAVSRLPEAFSAGLDRAQRFANEVVEKMRAFPEPPDRIAVEFGLKLSAKTGVVVAESTGEAHLKVTAEWSGGLPPRDDDDDDDDDESIGSDAGNQ